MLDIQPLQPYDEFNQELESNVHPGDWKNPTPDGRYNLVVLGAGTAGLVTAVGAAGLGAKVALVERELMGGDCLNVGCVPSKGIIRAARAMAAVREAGEFGVRVPDGVTFDFAAAMRRMRKLRAGISRHDSAARFQGLGVDVYLGQASFSGPDTVEVGGQQLQFKRAVIATGARAAQLPIPGLAEAGVLTNESIFSLTELPPRLAVVGAGPIGSEMAQTFARFGSQVTLIEKYPHILSREDADAAKIVQEAMIRDGVDVRCHTETVRLATDGDEKIVYVKTDAREEEVRADQVLVGIGRQPNVEGLNLEKVGVEYDARAGVTVNDKLQTTNPQIYAAGDICSRFKFTHAADFMARLVIANTLFKSRRKASALTIPWCTYTSPELAHVGLTAAEADRQSVAIDTFTQPLDAVDRAILDGETEGFVKIHVAQGKDKIVGATIVAENAGDMIGSLSIAMTNGIGLGKIANSIHPYPTQAEAIRKAGDLYNR
ncbi:MAG: mercuric reductase, partial [Planctomycetota bacterium]